MTKVMTHTKDKTAGGKLRRWMMGVVVMTMVGTTVAAAMTPNTGHAVEVLVPSVGRDGRVVMYAYDGNDLLLKDEHAHLVDQLNFSFALIENGAATGDHWRNIGKVEAYLRRHPHMDGVVSVGGWGADGFSDACATPEGRAKLADSILSLMDRHGFVGVDIDWEYPGFSSAGIVSRPEDEENWYELLALLRAGLDARETANGREYYLSVAIGCGDEQLNAVDGKRLNALVDQAVLMTYDLSGFEKITGHHSGLYPNTDRPNSGNRAVKKLLADGLAADKMLLGFPSYSKMWRQVSGGGTGLHQRAATSGNKSISFDETMALENQGYTAHYDEEAAAAYWFNGENFVSGENQRSIDEKVAWLRAKGLQGCAVWCWNQDPSSKMAEMLDAALRK